MDKTNRIQIKDSDIEEVMVRFKTNLQKNLKKHGRGALVSLAEIWGKIDEEVDELKDEVRENNITASFNECIDIMTAAFLGAVSINIEAIDEYHDLRQKMKKEQEKEVR